MGNPEYVGSEQKSSMKREGAVVPYPRVTDAGAMTVKGVDPQDVPRRDRMTSRNADDRHISRDR